MRYLILLLLVTSCQITDIANLKSDKFSFREKTNDEWNPFSEWDSVTTHIQIKKTKFIFSKSTITILEKKPLKFKVIGQPIETKSESGLESLVFNCKDEEGLKCHIIMIDQNPNVRLVVYYNNLNLCYNVTQME